MAEVRWSVDAQADLRSISDSRGRRSARYGEAIARRIAATVRGLAEFPQMGRMVPEYEHPDIRELIVLPYRVLYRLENDGVGVIGIIHGSQDVELRFGGEPWLT